MAHDAYAGDDGLVLAQSHVEIESHGAQQQNEHSKPEQWCPLAPVEGYVLYVLGREHLVGMKRVHLYGEHLQPQSIRCIVAAVDLHLHAGDSIDVLIKRRDSVYFPHSDVAVVHVRRVGCRRREHFHSGHDRLRALKRGERDLAALLGHNIQRDVGLLTNEHLYGVHVGLHLHLSHCHQRNHQQQRKNKISDNLCFILNHL